ncbi:JAB domain-containing protein [Kosakonia oryziphila]|uniref:DNA repair protein RadC n=1 Tax=Kosakonia oryziphila TaxID=1005667 RepID=A0A1C4G5I3_9ENTR|nr:JAB domain-containing protein [Kosakonia oryziphila]SCC63125.1 DNA repair protein RadC [Kosakonia oryziphila]
MSEINLPPDLPVTEARTIRRAIRLLEKYQRQPGEQFHSTTFTKTWLQLRLALQEREVFLVLYLDNQNRLLECETLFTGTINHTEVHLALRHNAAAVILAHNHPSGETEPSKQDRNITQHLVNALAMVDVRVLDHLIVGIGDVLSFAERGWL